MKTHDCKVHVHVRTLAKSHHCSVLDLVCTEDMGSCGGRISAIQVMFLLLLLAVVQISLEVASQDGSHGDSNQIDPMCSTEHGGRRT